MVNLINALLCSRVIRDVEKNTISIIEIVENITFDTNLKDKPLVINTDLDLFTHWSRDNDNSPVESVFKVFYKIPNGEQDLLKEIPLDLTKHFFYRAIIHLNNIKINGSGTYYFIIKIINEKDEWVEIKSIPFLVLFKEEKAIAE